MKKNFAPLILVALTLVLELVSGCSVSTHEETCILNDRKIDCADMPGRNPAPVEKPPSGGHSTPSRPEQPVQFSCGNEACETKNQYCLRIEDSYGRTALARCRSKEVCDSCDCVMELAKVAAPTICGEMRWCASQTGSLGAPLTVNCKNGPR